jgi:hypothetical protein
MLARAAGPRKSPAGAAPFSGAIVLTDFITAAEEARVLAAVDACAWQQARRNGRYRSQLYGRFRTDGPFARPGSRPGNPRALGPFGDSGASSMRAVVSDELPPWAVEIGARIAASAGRVLAEHPDWSRYVQGLDAFRPNQMNVNSYNARAGDAITPHMDDRSISGPFICNLSLLADGQMTYVREKGTGVPENDTVKVNLPARSMHIMTGPARWSWKHAMLNKDIRGERRVSLTFRMV